MSDRVDQLVHAAPIVEVTPRQRVYRVLAVFFSLVATAALVLSLIGIAGVAAVASCTNNNLSHRNAPSARDADAHVDFLKTVLAALTGDESKAALTQHTRHDLRVLNRDQAIRAAHPLGKC